MNPLCVSPDPSPVAAWVGLDWADQQHVICLYEVTTGHSTVSRLEQKPEALQDRLSQLRQRFGGAPVAIVLEQARGGLIYALMSADFVRLYPVNPQSLAKFRKAFVPAGRKGSGGCGTAEGNGAEQSRTFSGLESRRADRAACSC